MWLINVHTFRLEEFVPERCPAYAILSHRWEEDEVSHKEMKYYFDRARMRHGFRKIQRTCWEAQQDQLDYVWVDTCCIDKKSSAELSEAINSMFSWYKMADICYVYLSDIRGNPFKSEELQRSAWFSRGWTLQELLAPREVRFYDRDWWRMGHKEYLVKVLHQITGIAIGALEGRDLQEFPVSEKMSWAARRITTRREDMAYCLLGIFDVNMPLLYGEGDKAFLRLQEEIIRHNNDHSIFNWKQSEMTTSGMLAPSISCFAYSTPVRRYPEVESRPFTLSNQGVSAKWEIHPWARGIYVAFADCYRQRDWAKLPIFLCPPVTSHDSSWRRIHLNNDTDEASEYQCLCSVGFTFWSPVIFTQSSQEHLITVPQETQYSFERPFLSIDTLSSLRSPVKLGFTVKCPYYMKSSFQVLKPPYEPGDRWRTFEEPVEISLLPGRYGLVCLIKPLSSDDRLACIALGYDFNMRPFLLAIGNESPFDLQSSDVLGFKGEEVKEALSAGMMVPFGSLQTSNKTTWRDLQNDTWTWRTFPNKDDIWAVKGTASDTNVVLALSSPEKDAIMVKHMLQVQFNQASYLDTGCLATITPLDPQPMLPTTVVQLVVDGVGQDIAFAKAS